MIVIFEGVDGSGKTTIINKLEKDEQGFKVDPPGTVGNYTNTDFLDTISLAKSPKTFLMDRSCISELIYSKALNRKTSMSILQFWHFICICKNGIRIVHCNNEKSFERSIERGEDNITDKKLHNKIKHLYDFLFKFLEEFLNINIMEYDYEKTSYTNLLNFIKGV